MALCSTPLPPACESELLRLAALVPDTALSALAVTEPAFQCGGFRAGKTSVLRLRFQQLASGSQEISEPVRRLLAGRSRTHTLTRLLSLETLSENRHALAALLGPPVLLVALLLDSRTEARAAAEAWLTGDQPFLSCLPSEALHRLRETFEGLTEILGKTAAEGVPVTREAWLGQKEQLDLRMRDLLDQNRRLKGVDDKLSGLSRQLIACEDKLEAASRKAEAAEIKLRQKNREFDEVATELARETARREERLNAAVDLALASEFHGWLASARTVETAAKAARPHADLLDQTAAALKRQAEIDRHSGNRAILADRLSQLQAAHQTVTSALRNALRQTPELKRTETDLAAEIQRLHLLLEPDAATSPLEAALVTRIHAAAENELPRLRELPDLIDSLHVLESPAVERLRNAFHKRLAASQAVGVPPDPRTEERQNTVSLLGQALAGQKPAILLIDGHNVLFGLPVRYNPPRGGALNDADKRKKLTDDIVRITAPNPAVRAWIVFDGPTRHDTQAAPNVRVTYSGGTGEHRADNVILDNVRFFQNAAPDTTVFLISNDHDLCQSARRLGAQDVAVLDLGAFL
jgi:hypothetical protein